MRLRPVLLLLLLLRARLASASPACVLAAGGDGGWVEAEPADHGAVAARALDEPRAPGEAAHPLAWAWSAEARACGAGRLPPAAVRRLLRGAWVGVLGDSVARLLYAALLRSTGTPGLGVGGKAHRSFDHALPHGARASFIWAPYADNVTTQLIAWGAQGASPSVLLMGAALWPMLHERDPQAQAHARALGTVRDAVRGLPPQAGLAPLCFWATTTALVGRQLNSDEKRDRLTPAAVDAYNRAPGTAQLLVPRGPCHVLDVHRVTRGCGAACTLDGMHYSNTTYDVLLQLWLNAAVALVADADAAA